MFKIKVILSNKMETKWLVYKALTSKQIDAYEANASCIKVVHICLLFIPFIFQ